MFTHFSLSLLPSETLPYLTSWVALWILSSPPLLILKSLSVHLELLFISPVSAQFTKARMKSVLLNNMFPEFNPKAFTARNNHCGGKERRGRESFISQNHILEFVSVFKESDVRNHWRCLRFGQGDKIEVDNKSEVITTQTEDESLYRM